MQKFELPETIFRTLHGVPLPVFLLLFSKRQPLTSEYIERTTGYTAKPVYSALKLLEDYGLVSRNGRYAWQITAYGRQLPLMDPELPKGESDNVFDESDHVIGRSTNVSAEILPAALGTGNNSMSEENNSDLNSGTWNNSISDMEKFHIPVPSSGSSLNLLNPELGIKPPLPVLDSRDAEKLRIDENMAACDRADIHEPKRSAISRMKHVTAKLIRYHTQTAKNIPLAIYRIEKGWKIKPGWVDVGVPAAEIIDVTPEAQEPELPEEIVNAWEEALKILEKQFRKVEFVTWIRPLQLMDYDGGMYRLQIGNRCGAEWLEKHALQAIEAALRSSVQLIVGG